MKHALAAVLLAASVVVLSPTGSGAAECTKTGTPGPDRLVGTSGKDVLCGLGGNDVLLGKGGNDVLVGGGGVDTLTGGTGSDALKGGSGSDVASYADHTSKVVVDLEAGSPAGSRGEQDTIATVESVVGGSGPDVLTGTDGSNALTGGGGDDQLYGGPGADDLSGGPADDLMIGGDGVDDLDGGGGLNTCDASPDEPAESSCRYDTSGPEIVSMETSQETYQPGDQFVLDLHVTDLAGAQVVGAYFLVGGEQNDFCDQFATFVAGSGTRRDGTWRVACTMPATARNGAYEAVPYAWDIMGNNTNTNGGAPDDTRATFSITGASGDGDGPLITSVETDAATYGPGDQMVVTVTATDESGINEEQLSLRVGGRGYNACDWAVVLVEGDATDGTWTFTCTLPTLVRNGTWTIYPAFRDVVNNWTFVQDGGPSATGSFVVEGGTDDASGPTIVSVGTNATSFAPGDDFVLSLHLTDATGVDLAGGMFQRSGAQNDFCGQVATLVSGTAQDGVWELACTVPGTAPVGHYVVTPYARDLVGTWVNTNGHDNSPLRAEFDIVA